MDTFRRRIPWGDLTEAKKIEEIRRLTRRVNVLERGVWAVADLLSGEQPSHTERIYRELIDAAKKDEQWRRLGESSE